MPGTTTAVFEGEAQQHAIVESLIQSTIRSCVSQQVEVSIDSSSTVQAGRDQLRTCGSRRIAIQIGKRRRGSGTKERSSPAQFVSRRHTNTRKEQPSKRRANAEDRISNDIWLHAKDIPGSHVIIRSQGERDPRFHTLQRLFLRPFTVKLEVFKRLSTTP